MTNSKLRFLLLAVMTVVLLAGLGGITRLDAQGTTATILGTVSDATGAVVAGAMVQVRNTGTGATQSIQSDPQGRYRVPDLQVGDYEVQVSKAGFSTIVHKGITLTVGSQNVVDFALARRTDAADGHRGGGSDAGGDHERDGRHAGKPGTDARTAFERPRFRAAYPARAGRTELLGRQPGRQRKHRREHARR